MAMSELSFQDTGLLQQLILSKTDLRSLESILQSKGYDKDHIHLLTREFKKIRASRRQFRGFIMLGGGAFLGFVSCVLTLINPVPELYNVFLYGVTSVALTAMIMGLYCIFED